MLTPDELAKQIHDDVVAVFEKYPQIAKAQVKVDVALKTDEILHFHVKSA